MAGRSHPRCSRTGVVLILALGIVSTLAALAWARSRPPRGHVSAPRAVQARRRSVANPPLAISFPAARGYALGGWRGGCARGQGACGTVRYARGLWITAAVRQLSTGRYWNGRGFSARRAFYQRVRVFVKHAHGRRARQASWYYRLALPGVPGRYRLNLRSMRRWHRHPRRLAQRSVTFAVDLTPVSPPSPGPGPAFTITGDAVGQLTPGGPVRSISLTLTNPGASAIYVSSVSASVEPAGLPTGCTPADFSLAQAVLPSAGVAVPAHGTAVLTGSQVTTPSIRMLDSGVDQNACAGAHLTISYSGSAHS